MFPYPRNTSFRLCLIGSSLFPSGPRGLLLRVLVSLSKAVEALRQRSTGLSARA